MTDGLRLRVVRAGACALLTLACAALGHALWQPSLERPASASPAWQAARSLPAEPTLLVNINQAQEAEIAQLPGIGESLARRIIAYRQERGPFATATDLLSVSGIGQGKLSGIRDLITCE